MRWSKRELLIAIAAALTAICFTTAEPAPGTAQSSNYKESPALAEQVKAGKLPPVEERLPKQPLVVPVVEKIDEYGGVCLRAFPGPAVAHNSVRVVYDVLLRFPPDVAKIDDNIAAAAEPPSDF